MRLLGVYFLLSDITIFYSYARGISPFKKWTEFIGLFALPALIGIYALLFAGASLLFYLMPRKFRTFTECFDPVLLITSVLVFSCTLVFRSDDFSLSVFVGLFALILVIYGASRIHPETLNRQKSGVFTAVPLGVLAAFILGFVCVTAVAIHRCFDTSTFDLGIFTQMFHSTRIPAIAPSRAQLLYPLSSDAGLCDIPVRGDPDLLPGSAGNIRRDPAVSYRKEERICRDLALLCVCRLSLLLRTPPAVVFSFP